MSYAAAIERLNALAAELHTPPGTPRRKFRLEDMRLLLAALGDPQRRFPSVLIAGTNGKGSTAATLASIVQAAGYRTALYTSPHLARPNERIQVNSQPISDEDFAAVYFQVESAAQSLLEEPAAGISTLNGAEKRVPHVSRLKQGSQPTETLPALPSFFETITAMAFLHFAALDVDLAVLEVGLGGRLDATNIVDPLLSILTDISLDHTEWLGTTIDAIAREKAGILRPNGVLVTLPQHPEANQAIGEIAVALNVRGINAAPYLPTHSTSPSRNRYPITVLGETIQIDSPLPGHHQQRNIALAIAAAIELRNPFPALYGWKEVCNQQSGNICQECNSHSTITSQISLVRNSNGYNIGAGSIESGIRSTAWPARLELLYAKTSPFPASDPQVIPEILLDVAHNPAGAWALRAAISQLFDERARPLTLIFGCLKDKAIGEMAQILFPLFDEIILLPVNSPRAASLDELIAAAAATGSNPHAETTPAAALTAASRLTPLDGLIVITGSVQLVGALRELLVSPAVPEQEPVR